MNEPWIVKLHFNTCNEINIRIKNYIPPTHMRVKRLAVKPSS